MLRGSEVMGWAGGQGGGTAYRRKKGKDAQVAIRNARRRYARLNPRIDQTHAEESTMNSHAKSLAPLFCALALSACTGMKVLKEPRPLPHAPPLVTVREQPVSASLKWVIVRDGPGTWAQKANWDEYLLEVRNVSSHPVQLDQVAVID